MSASSLQNDVRAELKLPAALPDRAQDLKAWGELQAILNPKAVDMEFPEDYCCPITHCLMRDPVSTADGQTYEREAIEAWLKEHDTSPLGGHASLKNKELTPIVLVKNMVQRYVDKKPALRDSKEWYLPQSWIGELAQACESGDEKAIQALAERDRRLLVHRFSEGRYAGKTALQLVAVGHLKALEVVIALLEKRQAGLGLASLLQADASGWLPLHHAIHAKQNAEILLKLVAWMGQAMERVPMPKSWPNGLNTEGLQSALRWSLAHQEVAALRYCLRLGAHPDTPNSLGQTPVYQAVQKGFQEGLSVLLEAKADPNRGDGEGGTPLQSAIRQGSSDTVALLKRYGVDLTQTLRDGSTPLHGMAEHASTKMAEVLEQKSLNTAVLNAQDGEGCTPLHRAAAKGSVAMLRWFIEKGADLSIQNNRGQTILHLAARHNQVDVLGVLVERSDLLGVKDQEENTALHLAAQSGAREAVVCLLTGGASPQIKNQRNKTARQLAEEGGHRATVESWDKTVASLQSKEEEVMKAQGVLGMLLLKQQRLIEEQQKRLERQEEEIAQLKQALSQKLEDFRGSQQRIVQALEAKAEVSAVEALRENVRPLLEEEQKRREEESKRKQAEAKRAEEYRSGGWRSKLILPADSPLRAQVKVELKADEKAVQQLLQHVANGEQKEAEALIQRKPELLLCKGAVTDLSKREFKEITAFQYAVWALDWHMWRMLLKYLTQEEAGEQLRLWEGLGSHPHGKHASWQGLIDAYASYIPVATAAAQTGNWDLARTQWIKQIGGGQLLLPAHVVNEYCHGSRGFYPLPDFGNVGLELTRVRLSGGVDWYDVRCGVEWGHYRGNYSPGGRTWAMGGDSGFDKGAVAALLETRLRQRADLVKTLTAGLAASPGRPGGV